jgi:putative ABC transport system ATP-binding protein
LNNKLIVAKNLTHSFGETLFQDLNIELEANKSIAIVGVSGSGKTTLLHILAGFIKPNSGQVFHFGIDFASRNLKQIEEFRKKNIGMIFQSHYLFKGFSARENLEVAEIIAKKKIDFQILEKLGISNLLDEKVTKLSGGQQQRFSIARILTKQPNIIFADEPTGNLDRKSADEVVEIIFNYIKDKNRGLVLVTHDEKLASKCDNIIRL